MIVLVIIVKFTLHGTRQYLILLLTFLISLLCILVSDNIDIHIASFLFFCIVQIAVVNFDLFHPYCWFTSFFALYSCGFPIIISLGFSSRSYYTKEVMVYQLIALFVFLWVVGTRSLGNNKIQINQFNIDIGIFNKFIYYSLLIIIFITGIYVYRSGFGGKGEIYEQGNLILNLFFKLPLVFALLSTITLITQYSKTKKVPMYTILFSGIALGTITIFSGERDFIFRYVLMTLLAFWFLRIIELKHFVIIGPLLAASIPLSVTYKYYFTQGTTAVRALSTQNFLYSLFYGEFESASCNLQIILNDSERTRGLVGVFQILKDIASAFYSGIQSTNSLFNQYYYTFSKNVQYGFSLVGEGYLIGGVLGVILLFIIVGLITKYFYLYSTKNVFFLGGYIYYITVVIYSIRGDFSVITSALSKQIGLVLLILYLLNRFARKDTQGLSIR